MRSPARSRCAPPVSPPPAHRRDNEFTSQISVYDFKRPERVSKEQMRTLQTMHEGFGRTDALGRIGNTAFGDHLAKGNYQVGDAPVSYPYLWNIWKFDWVQYNGSVAQPLARNIGEALGVGERLKKGDRLKTKQVHSAAMEATTAMMRDAANSRGS